MTAEQDKQLKVFVVRADVGRYAEAFRKGGYVGIDAGFSKNDLSNIYKQSKDALAALYERPEPENSVMRKVVSVSQVWNFLNELMPGTIVITPTEEPDKLLVGNISGDYYYVPNPQDSPYAHRRPVKWRNEPLLRSALSVPTQNTLRSLLTIFSVSQVDEIAAKLGIATPTLEELAITDKQMRQLIMDRILQLSSDGFEELVTELLRVIGFDASKVGKTGDGGIDVDGDLEVYSLARMKLKVQVKRYEKAPIDHKAIHHFRASVPTESQGAFVTTSDFTKKAREEANRPDFKRIGLVNGDQFVDILVERYNALPEDIKTKLKLRPTLMPE